MTKDKKVLTKATSKKTETIPGNAVIENEMVECKENAVICPCFPHIEIDDVPEKKTGGTKNNYQ
jgi:hypothetical protein